VQLQGQALTTTVALIKALGGGWEARGAAQPGAVPPAGNAAAAPAIHPTQAQKGG
jgi:hypothetical protein